MWVVIIFKYRISCLFRLYDIEFGEERVVRLVVSEKSTHNRCSVAQICTYSITVIAWWQKQVRWWYFLGRNLLQRPLLLLSKHKSFWLVFLERYGHCCIRAHWYIGTAKIGTRIRSLTYSHSNVSDRKLRAPLWCQL